MACRVGCPTQDHRTWGECARQAHLRIGYCNSVNGWDYSAQKQWDADLTHYASAVKQGIEPETTRRASVDYALEASHDTGVGYGTSEWDGAIRNRVEELAS